MAKKEKAKKKLSLSDLEKNQGMARHIYQWAQSKAKKETGDGADYKKWYYGENNMNDVAIEDQEVETQEHEYDIPDMILAAAAEKPDDFNQAFTGVFQNYLQHNVDQRKLELAQSYLGVESEPEVTEPEVDDEVETDVEENPDAEVTTGDSEDEAQE